MVFNLFHLITVLTPELIFDMNHILIIMQIIAHRGASASEPENTLRSISLAIDLGTDLVEVDVRQSRDGELIIMHDPTVDRTTNGQGKVEDMSISQLKQLDAGFGEEIPTLTDVLELVDWKLGLVIEIKVPGIEDKVLDIINQSGIRNVLLASFYHPVCLKVKLIDPTVPTGVIFRCQPVKTENLARNAHANTIFPHHQFLSREMVEKCHEHGILVYPWVIDNIADLKLVRSMGVDGIVTNELIDKKLIP
jgi:glycerophosphoryl diester phosphodiesterase